MLNAASRRERLAMEDPQLAHLVTGGSNHTSPSVVSQTDPDDQGSTRPTVDTKGAAQTEALVWHCLWNVD